MGKEFQISVALQAVDRVTAVVEKVVGKTTSALKRLEHVTEHIKEHSIFGEVLNANLLANGIEHMAEEMGEFVKESFQAAVHMDAMTEGLTAVMHSSKAAHAEIGKLIDVAKLPGMGIQAALEGSLQLQAGGLSADMARKFMKGAGTALATVGKGKADMEGVLFAATRMLGKGKLDAIHINEMALRIPQLHLLISKIFGTSDTKKLEKSGLTITDFFKRLSEGMLKLPSINKDSILNQVDNLGDAFEFVKVAFGDSMMPVMKPIIASLADSFYTLAARIEAVIPKIEALADRGKAWLKANPWLIDGLRQIGGALLDVGKSFLNLGQALFGAARQGTDAKASFLSFVQAVTRAAEAVARFVNHLAKWARENPKSAQTLLKVVGALALLAVFAGPIIRVIEIVGKFAGAIGTAIKWVIRIGPIVAEAVEWFVTFGVSIESVTALWPALGAAITLLSGPVGWIIGAITVIAVIAIVVWRNWDKVHKGFISLFKFLLGESPFARLLRFINPLWGVTVLIIKNWDRVKSWFATFKTFMIALWQDILNSPPFQAVIKALRWEGKEIGAFWKWGTTDPTAARPAGPRAMAMPGGLLPMPVLPPLAPAGAHSTVHVQIDGAPRGTRVRTNLAPGHTVGMGYTNGSLLDH